MKIPQLLADIRLQATLQASLGERVQGSAPGSRAPLNLNPIDDSDFLFAHLVEFVEELAEKYVFPDLVKDGWWILPTGIQGFKGEAPALHAAASALVFTAVRAVSDFNEVATPALALVDTAQQFEKHYRPDQIGIVYAPRICPVCGRLAVHVSWKPGTEPVVSCFKCGFEPDPVVIAEALAGLHKR